jgi:hypothetical protein
MVGYLRWRINIVGSIFTNNSVTDKNGGGVMELSCGGATDPFCSLVLEPRLLVAQFS